MKELQFEKYHGLGNDFLLVRGVDVEGTDVSALAVKLCARTTGVGADGLISVTGGEGKPVAANGEGQATTAREEGKQAAVSEGGKPTVASEERQPLEMAIHNSDGSLAPMCGNGIRCFALYAVSHGLEDRDVFPVKTEAGEMVVKVVSREPFIVEINMGRPDFSPRAAGVDTDMDSFLQQKIEVPGYGRLTVSSVLMGTYHTVVWMDSTDGLPALDDEDGIRAFGRAVKTNQVFSIEQNVNMALLTGEDEITARTYERGAGLTDACGTGACAAAVIAAEENKTGDEVTVHLKYGDLAIRLEGGEVYMRGPAALIARGTAVVD
ncbi:MAG: diaminopimelate epimerase [Clostridiales Family XIII bacterium]|nr:diaminopimelate epimerase [Clostridiales Family XIII bacterium]